MMAKKELRTEWATRIEAYKSSGQTQAAFCTEHGLHVKQLDYWLRKFRKEAASQKAAQWMKVEVHDHKDDYQDSVLNICLGRVVIEVKPGFNQKHLQDVVKALSSLC